MEDRQEIFTAGFPRSGNTWLNRLLCDLLSSPMQTEAGAVIEWPGVSQDGIYVIRKTHRRGDEKLDWGKWVFIQRDPRDVAVSTMYYYGFSSLLDTLSALLNQEKCKASEAWRNWGLGEYEPWVSSWLDYPGRADVMTRYELLHSAPFEELDRLVYSLTGERLGSDWIRACHQRQNFSATKKRYDGHAVRRGIVGDWHNYFNRMEGRMLDNHLGQFMLEQNYIQNRDWWKSLPIR